MIRNAHCAFRSAETNTTSGACCRASGLGALGPASMWLWPWSSECAVRMRTHFLGWLPVIWLHSAQMVVRVRESKTHPRPSALEEHARTATQRGWGFFNSALVCLILNVFWQTEFNLAVTTGYQLQDLKMHCLMIWRWCLQLVVFDAGRCATSSHAHHLAARRIDMMPA